MIFNSSFSKVSEVAIHNLTDLGIFENLDHQEDMHNNMSEFCFKPQALLRGEPRNLGLRTPV